MQVEQQTRRDVLNTYYAKIKQGKRQDIAIAETVNDCDVKPSTVKRYLREEKYFVDDEPSAQTTGELAGLVAAAIRARKRTVIELADLLNVPPKSILAAIEELKSQHLTVDNLNDSFQIAQSVQPVTEWFPIDLSKHAEQMVPFGAIADTHNGSDYERLDVLNALYDRFASEGVKDVFLAGNWIDGECRFNKHHIYVHGAQRQVRNFLKVFPSRKGIVTHVLSGDDHEGWWTQREGINMGQMLMSEARNAGREHEFVDLGYMERDIELKQAGGSAALRIVHLGGGSSYATSYAVQKYAESLQGGEKPKIGIFGHTHKYDSSYPREIHCVQVGCVQDQTPFMRKHKLEAHVGGCMLWVRQADNGVVTSVRHEWFPFYDKHFYQYHW